MPGSFADRSALAPALSIFDKLRDGNPEREGTDNAEREIRHNRMRADAHALRWVAEKECPESVKEFGRVNGIPTFAEFTWNHGFEQGWRMAMAFMSKAETGGSDGRRDAPAKED